MSTLWESTDLRYNHGASHTEGNGEFSGGDLQRRSTREVARRTRGIYAHLAPGASADRVQKALAASTYIGSINWAETLSRMVDLGLGIAIEVIR